MYVYGCVCVYAVCLSGDVPLFIQLQDADVPAAHIDVNAPVPHTRVQHLFAEMDWHQLTGKRVKMCCDVYRNPHTPLRIIAYALIINAVEMCSRFYQRKGFDIAEVPLLDVLNFAYSIPFQMAQFLSAILARRGCMNLWLFAGFPDLASAMEASDEFVIEIRRALVTAETWI